MGIDPSALLKQLIAFIIHFEEKKLSTGLCSGGSKLKTSMAAALDKYNELGLVQWSGEGVMKICDRIKDTIGKFLVTPWWE